MAEQRAWVAGAGFARLDGLGVLRLTGRDRYALLQSLTTQAFDPPPAPGGGAEALILDPAGRIEFAFAVSAAEDATYVALHLADAVPLAQYLTAMRFTLDVAVEDVSADQAVFATSGTGDFGGALRTAPHATPSATPQALWTWDDPWPGVVPGGTAYALADPHPGAGWSLRLTAVPRADRPAVAAALAMDRTPVGAWALTALRIAAWRPWIGAAGVRGALPHELDWLRTAVHLRKGCYRGQETVAKVFAVGRPPRRLTLLHLDGSELSYPRAGAPVTRRDAAADGPVGVVTSVGHHHLLGPIALALLRRSLDPAADLLAAGVPATQEVIVPPSGEATDRPKIDIPPGLGRRPGTRALGLSGRAGSAGGAPPSAPPGTRGLPLSRPAR